MGKQASVIKIARAAWEMKTTRNASAYDATAASLSEGSRVGIFAVFRLL
jgi:hypothetical protein